MKKLNLLFLTILLTLTITSCKKSELLKKSSNSNGIDIDLSKMNYEMISSIVFDILVAPENYVNKHIKTTGKFYTAEYEGQRYFSVLTWDATGCCPAGLDFIPPEGMNYPEDFPDADETITVTGVFKYLEKDGMENFVFQAEKILIQQDTNSK